MMSSTALMVLAVLVQTAAYTNGILELAYEIFIAITLVLETTI